MATEFIIFILLLVILVIGLAYKESSKKMAQPIVHNQMIMTEQVYSTHHLGFSQAIVASNFIFTSGQVGWDIHYQCTDYQSFEIQTKQSFLNIEEILKAGNSSMNQVVLLRLYVKDLDEKKRKTVNKYLHSFYPTFYKPATSLIGVANLAQQDLLIEIEAIAQTHQNNLS